nr:hypothetical protein Iba_chr11bCG13670 [Ipomoea batatas]
MVSSGQQLLSPGDVSDHSHPSRFLDSMESVAEINALLSRLHHVAAGSNGGVLLSVLSSGAKQSVAMAVSMVFLSFPWRQTATKSSAASSGLHLLSARTMARVEHRFPLPVSSTACHKQRWHGDGLHISVFGMNSSDGRHPFSLTSSRRQRDGW